MNYHDETPCWSLGKKKRLHLLKIRCPGMDVITNINEGCPGKSLAFVFKNSREKNLIHDYWKSALRGAWVLPQIICRRRRRRRRRRWRRRNTISARRKRRRRNTISAMEGPCDMLNAKWQMLNAFCTGSMIDIESIFLIMYGYYQYIQSLLLPFPLSLIDVFIWKARATC